MKRYILFLVLFLWFSQWTLAQQWAVKGLPVPLPLQHQTILLLPLAVEYTNHNRFSVQISPAFIYTRSQRPYTIYPQSQYITHYHLNLSTRRYLGKKTLNRAWFVGATAWWSTEYQWSKEPIAYNANSNDIWRDYGGRNRYKAIGGFLGKSFRLRHRWFLETKLSVLRVTSARQSKHGQNNEQATTVSYHKAFGVLPNAMIGYRW